jgi:hypothetical protein
MPHDGSGTRSGSAAAGGFARYGTRGSGASARARARDRGGAGGPQHLPFTIVTLTVAVASAALIPNSRTYCGAIVAVTA